MRNSQGKKNVARSVLEGNPYKSVQRFRIFQNELLFTALLTIFSATHAHAAKGAWSEDFGQGNLEYSFEFKEAVLNIFCPTEDGLADTHSSLSASVAGSELTKFSLIVNKLNFEGPFEANSIVGTNNFLSLIEALKKSDAILKYGNKTVIFPLNKSSKVLPTYGTNSFKCNLD